MHGDVIATPQSPENIGFTVGNLDFRDMFVFLASPLVKLVEKMKKEDLIYTKRYFEKQVLRNEIPFNKAGASPLSVSSKLNQAQLDDDDDEEDDDNLEVQEQRLSITRKSRSKNSPQKTSL